MGIYKIIVSKVYPTYIRANALGGLVEVAKTFSSPTERLNIAELSELGSSEFEKAVEWDKVNYIMEKYVPGWEKQVK